MSIYESAPRKTYAVGASAQAAFAVPFTFWRAADLRVYVDDVRLTSGYTVSGGAGAGGTVTLAASVTNTTVAIVRRLPIERTTDFPNAGPLKTPAVNRQLDQHTAIMQQLDDDGARSLRLPEGDAATGAPLPPLAGRANRILGFDADGKPTVSTSSIAQLDALTLAALQAGKVAEVIEPFEADGETSTITTTAPLVAAAQVTLLVGGIVQRPESGAYTVSGTTITMAEPPPEGVVVGGFVGFAAEVGKIVDDVGIVGGRLVIAYVDGETVDLGQVVGTNGTNGRGIANAAINGSNHLIITYTDGTTVDVGVVVGGVTSVAGRTGAVTLTVADVAGAAPLVSPALTGTPTVPTAAAGTNSAQAASTAFVQAAIAALLGSAPAALDTLNELAAALGNDANFATTVTNALAAKAPLASPVFTGQMTAPATASDRTQGIAGQSGSTVIWALARSGNNLSIAGYGAVQIYTGGGGTLTGGAKQVEVLDTASAARSLTLTGATSGSNPKVGTSAGDLDLTSATGVLRFNGVAQGESVIVAAGDEATAITTGTAKVTIRMPYAFTVTAVRASLVTAQTSGSLLTIDVKESGASIFSTKPTFNNGSRTTVGATTPAVISDTALADDAEITIDVTQIGDGTAKGLKVTLIGRRSA